MAKTLLRLSRVREHVGLSRAEIYRLIRLGRFPKQVPLGQRIRAWDADEVEAWVQARIDARAEKVAA